MKPQTETTSPSFLTKKMGLYMTIYSSCVSPCGNYLACSNNYGHVMIFKLTLHTGGGDNQSNADQQPFFIFKAAEKSVYHLSTINTSLVSCGYGPITAWSWADLIRKKMTKVWAVEDHLDCEYYNSFVYNDKEDLLYAGSNTGDIVAWDTKAEKKLDVYSGHQSQVYDLSILPNGFVSVADDGTMRLWDVRSAEAADMVEPFKNAALSQNRCGKYLSCVTADNNGDWIVCGGGPRLALYRRNMLDYSKPLEEGPEKFYPNVVTIFNDEIVAGGNLPSVHRWHMNGDQKATIPLSINSVFCVSSKGTQECQNLPLILAGADYKVSVLTNLGYESMVLKSV